MWRPSSIVLACVLALCVLPGVKSFQPFFPDSNMFSNIFPFQAAHPANFFHQNLFPAFFNFPQQTQPMAKHQRQQEVRFPSALECRNMCLQREEQSLANAKYRTESDGNGGLNLFVEFQDNGEPISMKNVNLHVREDISRRVQLHPFAIFPHLGTVPQQPKFILDVSLSRHAPVPDQHSAWCGCASPREEKYAKAFALPQGTDLSKVQAQLLLVDENTIGLKVQLPKFTKTAGKEIAAEKNVQIDNRQKHWAQEQEQQKRLKDQAIAEAQAQAAAQRKAAAEEQERVRQEQLKEQLQQLLQQREQQQMVQRERQQQELRERERAAQLERQREERIRKEQQQRERQQQQERQRQLEAEAAARRAASAAAAEAEAERLLAERKEKVYRQRFGAEGEVIMDLGDVNARQNKKYAQLSEERRQWKDTEVVFLD